jgi:SNF family Na+-dependent transporter
LRRSARPSRCSSSPSLRCETHWAGRGHAPAWPAGWFPLASIPLFAKATLFDLIDHLTSNVLLPAAGFGLAIFVGWLVPKRALADELGLGRSELALLRWLLRYLVPIGIAVATITPFF